MKQSAFGIWLRWMIFAGLLCSGNAWAATYTFGQGWFSTHSPPPCQGGSWSNSGSTYTCSGRVVLAAGDIVIVSTAFLEPLGSVLIRATGGFTLPGSTIGTAAKNISLETDFNTIAGTGTNNIYGSVTGGSSNISLAGGTITGSLASSSGAITLNGTTVSGTLTSSGANNLTNATIGGAAQITNSLIAGTTRFNSTLNVSSAATLTGGSVTGAVQVGGVLDATGTVFSNNVTAGASATLNAGSVSGALAAAGNITTTNATTIGGAATSTYGTINLGGGSVGGKVTGPNGVTSTNTNITGDVAATGGAINLSGGTINGNISDGCCRITLSGVTLTGNVSATNNDIAITGSTITGNLTSTNSITLANTQVTGDVTAATWSTITGTGSSKVVGTCTPSVTSPVDLCQTVVVPTCVTDNFNRTNLGSSDWAVTSRNGSFGVPRIVGNRLRLTDNSGNVATGATFQRLLPATGNYVQVQFKYYAYNGNGADGVAVIFSDASVTPQPGGYGGSLGYAQLNGTSGFAGGWLGVALDEYGNFSNPTETRDGGPGLRQDSVSIRGSGTGTGGYRYLAGTSANLNPGIDVSGSTAGPGHTYRITLDSTVTGRTMVTVERNTGSGFTTLISSFNAQAAAGQLGLPTDFFLSLTGSTGGSNNIHELDDFQVCANRMNPVGQQIDHFEYSYSGTALTCNPQPITIKACLNSSCSSLYTDPVRVTMSPTSGWSATAPATVTGGNVINFSGGSATTQLRSGAGEIVIGEISSLPASRPLTQRVCSTSGCKVTFSDSAFLLNVPHMVSGKEVDATIQAVRKADNAEVCVPGFANVTRDVRFNAVYSNPDSGTRSVIVNGTNISTTTDADKTSATPTTLSLTFDSIGRADPKLKVRYNDAGLMTLYASHVDSTANPGSSGYLITGSDTFIARPAGLCVYSDTVNSDCAGGDASCSKFVMAGDSFRLRVGGVVWQSNNDSDLCSGNLKTPNYRQNGIALTHALVAPVGGEAGNLGVVTTDIVASDQGERILTSQTISEVGVFTITATAPANYLGSSNSPTPRVGDTDNDGVIDVVSTSVNIGRFYPASFSLEDPAVKSACNAFTYAGLVDRDTAPVQLGKVGQPFPATGVLSARNRSGGVTRNYVGGFAKLKGSDISYADSGGQGVISTGTTDLAADASKGSGYLKYASVGLNYQFDQLRGPYKLAALITATDNDGVTGSVTDHVIDDATGAPDDDLLPDFRIGQARIANAHGSELQDLALPFFAAYFNGSGYAPNPLDSCTPFTPTELDDYQRSGTGDGSPALVDQSYMALAGGGAYLLKAPGESSGGSQWVTFGSEQSPAPEWLRFDWDEDGELDNPRGLATFGIYKGAAPLIFRREVYGQ